MQITATLENAAAPRGRFRKRYAGWGFLVLWLGVGVWNVSKPMPPGTNIASPPTVSSSAGVKFLFDRTFHDIQGREHYQQQIFDAVFDVIDNAHSFVVADFFLFNESMGAAAAAHRQLSSELAQHLIARKLLRPNLSVLVITDPINDVYGGARAALLDDMRKAGIDVIMTDLEKLRDSNPAYSSVWRLFLQWWGNAPEHGSMPNPFDAGPARITLRSWLALLNFKANHRKLVVADRADGNTVALITSANPHDASSAHSNVGIRVEGDVAREALASELAVARFSGWKGHVYSPGSPAQPAIGTTAAVQVSFITETAIRDHLVRALAATRSGDTLRIAVFYLSDRQVIDALLAAASRGVAIKLILDPNKDAFGRQKDGVPNRPVANELVHEGGGNIEVRWYRTHGEQFHTKLALITHGDTLIASLGSANLTRRNLANYNLEANIALQMQRTTPLATQMLSYFDQLWNNESGPDGQPREPQFTAPFGAYQDTDRKRYWRYRLMEATGLSTF
jgi:hypothetical protein